MAIIPLTQNQQAIINDEDFNLVMSVNRKWCAALTAGAIYYAVCGRPRIYMHHIILPKLPGFVIDHIDRDGLNNSRSNLRHVTHADNLRNRRIQLNNVNGYPGIDCRGGRTKPWFARIVVNKKLIAIGYFKTREEAIEARRTEETKHGVTHHEIY